MTPIALSMVVLGILAHFLPQWTRPDLYFGVTIDPALRRADAGRRALRRFRIVLWSATAVAIVVLPWVGRWPAALVQAGGFLLALSLARQGVLAHASAPPTSVEVDLKAPTETLPSGVLVALLPLLSSAILAWWASRNWSRLPQQIPVHFGLRGANSWIGRTPADVCGFIGVQAAMSAMFVLAAWGTLHWSRRISARGARAAYDRHFRRVNIYLFLAASYVLAAAAWFALADPGAAALVVWGLVALIAVSYLVLIQLNRHSEPAAGGDQTSDDCWKLGMFYVNRADPAVFVAKRFGIGYTFNLGNPWTWIGVGAIIVAAVGRTLLR